MAIDVKSFLKFNSEKAQNELIKAVDEPYRLTSTGGVQPIYAVNRKWPIENRRNIYHMVQAAQIISKMINGMSNQSMRRVNVKKGSHTIVSILGSAIEWQPMTTAHHDKYLELKSKEEPTKDILTKFLPYVQYRLSCNKRVRGLEMVNEGWSEETRSNPNEMLNGAIAISNATPGAEIKIYEGIILIATVTRGTIEWFNKDRFAITEKATVQNLTANLTEYMQEEFSAKHKLAITLPKKKVKK